MTSTYSPAGEVCAGGASRGTAARQGTRRVGNVWGSTHVETHRTCYWKWPCRSWVYPSTMVIFNRFLYVYQRVSSGGTDLGNGGRKEQHLKFMNTESIELPKGLWKIWRKLDGLDNMQMIWRQDGDKMGICLYMHIYIYIYLN